MASTAIVDAQVGQGNRTEHTTRTGSRTKHIGIVGLVFVVIYVVGLAALNPTPEYDATDAAWTDWFADGGNRTEAIATMAIFIAASIVLLWFTSLLVVEIRRRRGTSGSADTLALVAGTAAAAVATVGAIIGNATALALAFGPGVDVVPSAETLKWLELVGVTVILIGAGWSQSIFLASASYAARAAGLFPKWLTTAGFVGAVVLLASPVFIPMLAFPLWVLAASVILLRGVRSTAWADNTQT